MSERAAHPVWNMAHNAPVGCTQHDLAVAVHLSHAVDLKPPVLNALAESPDFGGEGYTRKEGYPSLGESISVLEE
jgi:hypothetical protein